MYQYALILLCSLFMPSCLSATLFAYKNMPGDSVGAGESNEFMVEDPMISNSDKYPFIQFSFDHENFSYGIRMEPALRERFIEGTYKNAKDRSTFENPMISVYMKGKTCRTQDGEFKILELKQNMNGKITKLAVDFVQTCSSNNTTTAPLYGVVRYHSEIPNDLENYIASFPGVTKAELYSQKGAFVGDEKHIALSDNEAQYDLLMNGQHQASFYYGFASGFEHWIFHFFEANTEKLQMGYFPNAGKYQSTPPNAKDNSEFEIYGDNRGCTDDYNHNSLISRFKVLQADFAENGKLNRFASIFEQRCAGHNGSLFGYLLFHSNIEIDMIAPAEYSPLSGKLILSLVQIDSSYKAITLRKIMDTPLSFRVEKIEETPIKSDDIKVPAYLYNDTYNHLYELIIPSLSHFDAFGKKHILENIQLSSPKATLGLGDVLTLKIENRFRKTKF